MRFVAVGDAFVDVVADRLPQPGERRHGSVAIRAGGSSLNAALTAARLGANSTLVARVGADAAGDVVVGALEQEGVVAHVARDPDLPTGVAVALGDAVVADRGANARLSPDDVPDPLAGEALLVSGFALFQEGSRDAALLALERFAGAWTAVDLASARLARLDFEARIVFATVEEAKAVAGLERRYEIVCVKDADGASVRRAGQTLDVGSRRVVETTPFGGGDAFAAAFLVALGKGAEVGAALERAVAAGARAAAV